VQENYIKSSTDVFGEIKKQRNFISVRIGELQRRFLEIIQRSDDKLVYYMAIFLFLTSKIANSVEVPKRIQPIC